MIDYHSHILPYIDDGSDSPKTSVKMLKLLKSQGVDTCFLTPHFYIQDGSIDDFLRRRDESLKKLKLALSKEDMSLVPEIKVGAEVYYYEGITVNQDLWKLKLEDTKILLLEMPPIKWTNRMIDDLITLSRSSSTYIILAHIERYKRNLKEENIKKLVDSGIRFQVNASLFKSFFGRRFFKKYEKYIDLIGSDSHDMKDRKPNYNLIPKELRDND